MPSLGVVGGLQESHLVVIAERPDGDERLFRQLSRGIQVLFQLACPLFSVHDLDAHAQGGSFDHFHGLFDPGGVQIRPFDLGDPSQVLPGQGGHGLMSRPSGPLFDSRSPLEKKSGGGVLFERRRNGPQIR